MSIFLDNIYDTIYHIVKEIYRPFYQLSIWYYDKNY